MTRFNIELYNKESGEVPIAEFLESLDRKMHAKTLRAIDLLSDFGNAASMPLSRSLGDGIFELRAQADGNISRVLYFFYVDQTIVLTHGFIKKTQKTPVKEMNVQKNIETII